MTTFLLLRHASHDWLGRGIAGRSAGVSLNGQGVREAGRLPAFLAAYPISAIYSSPRERTLETAAPVATARGLAVTIRGEFDEIDFGDWTRKTFDQVDADPRWRDWCEHKGRAGAPGGETFEQVRQRALAGLQALAALHSRDGHLLVVAHGDVIKALVATVLGLPLDHVDRFEIAPASLSVVETGAGGSRVRLVNATAPPP